MGLKVLKAAPGDKLKHNRRKRKEQLETWYQTKATPEQRKMVDDLQSSYISKQQSMGTSMNRQSATWLWDDFSNRVWDIAQGKNQSELYSTIDTRVVDEDPYGHYSKDQVAAIGNSIAQNYFRQTPTTTQEPAAEQAPAAATPTVSPYNYQWNKGFYSTTAENKDNDRSTLLATLINNIQSAIEGIDAKKVFHNVNGGDILSKETLSSLKSTLEGAQSVTWGNNQQSVNVGLDVLSAMKRLSNNDATAEEYYNQYFKFDPSAAEQFEARMKELGYTRSNQTFKPHVSSYLGENNYSLWQKNGKTYVLDADGQPVQASTKIWYDPNDSNTYKTTFAIGPDGTYYYGGIGTDVLPTDSPFRGQVDDAIKRIRESYDTLSGNTLQTYSPYLLQSDLVEKIAETMRNENMSPTNGFDYLDMGYYMYGDDPYIGIYTGKGTGFEKDFHAPDFNQFVFYTLDDQGKVIQVQLSDIQARKYLKYQGDPNDTKGRIIQNDAMQKLAEAYPTSSLDENTDIFGRWYTIATKNKIIENDPKEYIKFIVDLLSNPDKTFKDSTGNELSGTQIKSNLGIKPNDTESIRSNVAKIINYMYKKDVILDLDTKKALTRLAEKYAVPTQVQVNAKGGILYAEEGRNLGKKANEDAVKIRARQQYQKYDKYDSIAEGDNANRTLFQDGFSTTDAMRIGSLLADIASTGLSFAKGWGSVASAGAGAASTVMDFISDWAEDGLQLKDVGKLFGNLFLDASGSMITPLKFVKLSKKLKTMVPLLETSIAVLGGGATFFSNMEGYKQVINKIKSGTSLNIEDMKTLASGLTAIASMSRVGTQAYHQRRIKNASAKLNPKEAGFAVSTNKGDKELTKNQIDQIMAVKPASGETALAAKNKKLQELLGDTGVELKPDKVDGKHWWSKKADGTDWTAGSHVDFDKPSFSEVSGAEAQEAAQILESYKKAGTGSMSQYGRYQARWGTPGTVPTTTTTTGGQTFTPLNSTRKKDGGRLARLQNYIKNK